MTIFHICEHCNKEFELPKQNTITNLLCPYCNKNNNIWIRISD
jgi:DNA-directed RNA polymerase subunit RPC12/RpoP